MFDKRIPQLFLGAVTVLALIGFSLTSLQTGQLKQKLAEKRRAIVELTTESHTLQEQLAKSDHDRQELQARLGDLRKQLTATTDDLTHLRETTADWQSKVAAFDEERARFADQINHLIQERDEAQQRMAAFEKEKTNAQQSAGRLRERLALLDRDYERLAAKLTELREGRHTEELAMAESQKGSDAPPSPVAGDGGGSTEVGSPAVPAVTTMELPPIVVREGSRKTGPEVQAKVLEVNGGSRFVVLDKGSEDGVDLGMSFDVLRDGQVVGQVIAIRVRPKLSACDFGTIELKHPIRVGDAAVEHRS